MGIVPRSRRLLSRAHVLGPAIAALGSLWACAAQAQYRPPPQPIPIPQLLNPLAPGLGAPQEGTHAATPATTRPTFTWTQGGMTVAQPPAPEANYFVVCLTTGTTACAWPGTWNAAATAIPRTEIVTWTGVRTGRYNYTFLAPGNLPANLIDRELKWNVGACRSQANSSCTFGTAKTVWFSTKDLRADNISDAHGSNGDLGFLDWDLVVRNEGSTASGPFGAGMVYVEVYSAGGNCLTDRNAAVVSPSDYAYLTNGTYVEVADLAANAAIVAIGPSTPFWLIAPRWMHPGLDPGASAVVGSINESFDWKAGETQVAFVAIAEVDYSGTLREFDENDNKRVECSVVFR